MARILFVDDDAERSAEKTVSVLKQAGHEVIYCDHVHPASHVLAEKPIDLVITDIAVWCDDGTDLVRQAKSLDPPVSAILLDGGASRMVAKRCGADDWYLKTWSIDGFLQKVNEVLARRSAPDSEREECHA